MQVDTAIQCYAQESILLFNFDYIGLLIVAVLMTVFGTFHACVMMLASRGQNRRWVAGILTLPLVISVSIYPISLVPLLYIGHTLGIICAAVSFPRALPWAVVVRAVGPHSGTGFQSNPHPA